MPRTTLFSNPLLLGFDELANLLDSVTRSSSDGYPPYNIEHVDERQLSIELAVAGFDAANLEVSVENNQLLIRGKQAADEKKAFLHRGIANRQFVKKFVLAENMEVTNAHLHNGLLTISLERPKPRTTVQIIKIVEGAAPAE
ncbi:MAG: Hsp20 family protein [Sphingomonadales bacterium]|nr:Hsp20 family protein [Sphingomonadales bacterium]